MSASNCRITLLRAPWRRVLLRLSRVLLCAGAMVASGALWAESRYPEPDFESGYIVPTAQHASARAVLFERLDVAVLAVALGLAAFLVLRRRSRAGVVALTVFSLAYFGFWRYGCICPVGALQNVMLAMFDSSYAVPATVVLLFSLPLFSALLFGRVFCAAVCPLGAIQDVLLLRPVRVPAATAAMLGMLPVVFLAATALLVGTGAGFPICQLDPFVGFFRFGGRAGMLIFGGVLLLIGVFIARPYCRFLCPYGVLLGWLSRLSWRHATITPDECIRCRLCEDVCPVGAIRAPTPARDPESRAKGVRRLTAFLVLLPVLCMAGWWTGNAVAGPLSRVHRTVLVAELVERENRLQPAVSALEVEAFRSGDQTDEQLFADATRVESRFRRGGRVLGALLGLLFGLRLIGLCLYRHRSDYTIDREACISCSRCFKRCPREQLRRRAIRRQPA